MQSTLPRLLSPPLYSCITAGKLNLVSDFCRVPAEDGLCSDERLPARGHTARASQLSPSLCSLRLVLVAPLPKTSPAGGSSFGLLVRAEAHLIWDRAPRRAGRNPFMILGI